MWVGASLRRERWSRLLYQMALGTDVKVGVIALKPDGHEPSSWWLSSAGVRTVIGEVIAYTYVTALFWP